MTRARAQPLQLAAAQLLNLPILDDAEVELRHHLVEDAALVARRQQLAHAAEAGERRQQ